VANCHNAAAAKRSGLTQALGRKQTALGKSMQILTLMILAVVVGLIISLQDVLRRLKDLQQKSNRQHDLLIALARRQGIDPVNPIDS